VTRYGCQRVGIQCWLTPRIIDQVTDQGKRTSALLVFSAQRFRDCAFTLLASALIAIDTSKVSLPADVVAAGSIVVWSLTARVSDGVHKSVLLLSTLASPSLSPIPSKSRSRRPRAVRSV
jgi:hypothetical protein